VRQPLARDREEPTVKRDPHDRLRHTQRDDLGVCDPTTGVLSLLRQEIVRRRITASVKPRMAQINGDAESVEVGVRVASWSTMPLDTADFGLSAYKSSTNTAPAVESLT
jgi:hypothetical protein